MKYWLARLTTKRRHKNIKDKVDETQNNSLLVSQQEKDTKTPKMKLTKHDILV
jgi:hypothetical protein